MSPSEKPKSEIRNPKSETNPNKTKAACGFALTPNGWELQPPSIRSEREAASGIGLIRICFGLRISDF
jgi:hypothetical protein